jgi:tetratricopeptide (TPR) repeat protein
LKIKNQKSKIAFVCVLCLFMLPVNGQRLNEAYLQAKAAMLKERYNEAGQKMLTIPASERTSSMYLTLGESFYQAGKYGEAARFFAISDSMRANPDAKLNAARAFAMMPQADKTVEWLQKYLSQRDKLSEGELGLDPAFANIERSREWRTLWSREWYNAAERKAAEAAVLIRRQKYTEALGIIDVEIVNRTSSARFYALRAKAYQAMEQFEPAYESAQTAIRMRNNHPEYFALAAGMAVSVRKYDMALDHINQAIRLDPYQLDLYLQRAAILRMNRRHDDARNDVNFYFKYLPDDTKAIYQMGLAETEAGNPLVGIEYFTMLIDNDQSSPDYFIARATAGIRANNYALAGYDLAQALDLNPALPDAWYKKGIVLQQENKLEDACYHWRNALKLGNREAAEYIYRHCIK